MKPRVSDLFAFKINYNQKENGTEGLFNGNITETLWRTSADNIKRKYNYSYDNLNRLLQANYSKPDAGTNQNNYKEWLNYDPNGNITDIVRTGFMDPVAGTVENLIDDLKFVYDTNSQNRLLKVNDISTSPQGFKDGTNTNNDFSYDNNGNMTADNNKGIGSIIYNHLNLPIKINFGAKGEITYLYNATGQKLQKFVKDVVSNTNNTTDYLSGFQYLNTTLQFFPHAEGYVHYTKPLSNGQLGSFNYVFNYTDHLGNVRVSFAKDPLQGNVLKILEENHYYPFGMKHENYNVTRLNFKFYPETGVDLVPLPAVANASYNYKYNGKELQEELGLNMYDYGARNYDPSLGRWMNMDPLAEQYRKWSPYTYCVNSPLRFVDPDGMRVANFGIDPPGSASNPHNIQTVGVSNNYATKEDKMVGRINSAVMTAENKSNAFTDAVNAIGAAMFGLTPDATDRYEGVACTGRYSPGESGLVPLAILASPLVIAEAGVAATAVTLESAVSGILVNTVSQGVANGGDLTKVNTVEALSSAIPGIGPTIVGETFNLPVGQIMQGNFMPSAPTSFEKGLLQIGGGLMSNKFGNKIDANPIFGQGVTKTYGEMAKFGVETGTNVLPLLGN